MKTIRAFVAFASLSFGALGLAATGCSSSSNGTNATCTDGGILGTCAPSCAQLCQHSSTVHCANDGDCLGGCQQVAAQAAVSCQGAYSALANCALTATFTCDANQQSYAASCSAQQTALETCLTTGGPAGGNDGGATLPGRDGGGTTLPGNDAGGTSATCHGGTAANGCEACFFSRCCEEYYTCFSDESSDCSLLDDCIASCDPSDTACSSECSRQYPSQVSQYNALATCANTNCSAACSGGGSDDAGGGTGGGTTGGDHPGRPTPANCLEVPDGISGDCGAGQFIYDCPNGQPYADCVYNPGGFSGIWCCNH